MKRWRCYIDPETGLTDVESLGSEDGLETFEVIEYSAYESERAKNAELLHRLGLADEGFKTEQIWEAKCVALTKERDEAKAEIARLQEWNDRITGRQEYQSWVVERTKSAKLVQALRFYSSKPDEMVKGQIEWRSHVCDSWSGLDWLPDWDGDLQDEPGDIAQRALAEYVKDSEE